MEPLDELVGYAAAIGRKACRRRDARWLADEAESVAVSALAAALRPPADPSKLELGIAVWKAANNWIQRELRRQRRETPASVLAAPEVAVLDAGPLRVDASDLYLKARSSMTPAVAETADALYLRGLTVSDAARERGTDHACLSRRRARAASALRTVLEGG